MVTADVNLNVWFDVSPNQSQVLVVPYVKSARDVRLQYQLNVVNTGKSGSSSISQGGTLTVSHGQPKAVSSVQVTPQAGGTCEIDLTLHEGDREVGQYSFHCMARK
jgi:hypothetical protein